MPITKFEAVRGDTNIYLLTFTNGDGSARDLTGATLWFTVKHSPSDPDSAALVQKKSGVSGFDLSNAALGHITLSLSPSDTSGLSSGVYCCDVQIRETNGNVSTPILVPFVLTGDITQGIV